MSTPPILSIMIFLPLICALLVAMVRGEKGDQAIVEKNVKHLSLFSSIFVFAFSLFLYQNYDPRSSEFQFVEQYSWFGDTNITYHLGVDGISLYFILLSAFLTPICILASWNSIKTRIKEYMIAFLVLESFMIGTFAALDTVLFYVFFEGVLIPMFLIIGIWGGARRVYASFKFFLYTLLGSVLMLLAILMLYHVGGSTDMSVLANASIDPGLQKWLWLAFFASFAVKMPMWPFHTWLPDAHVEAPTAGSVILAGVLLKMGGYGFLRFSLPMLPDASAYFAPMMMWLSVIAIIYTSLVALVQNDMKKLIAYSSVAHMGFVTLGIFSFTTQGVEGAIFQMISHGIISSGLFLCVGVVYDRLHTREIGRYGGLVNNMPAYAVVFMTLMLGSVGLPGTSGFVGEFLSLLGAFEYNFVYAALAAFGMVLGAAYMLVLYRRVIFGPQDNKDAAEMSDLNKFEKITLIPLVALVFYLGVFPNSVLEKLSPAVTSITAKYEFIYDARAMSEEDVYDGGLIPTPISEDAIDQQSPVLEDSDGNTGEGRSYND